MGATIAALLVGIVTLFADFPIDTIIWVIWAVVYQQLENTVIQPQIQRRAVDLHPFLVLVSVLFGATLFGVAGALLAIPGPPRCRSRRRSGGTPAVGAPRGPPGGVAGDLEVLGEDVAGVQRLAKRSMRSSSTLIASASAAASIWALSRSSASSSALSRTPPWSWMAHHPQLAHASSTT